MPRSIFAAPDDGPTPAGPTTVPAETSWVDTTWAHITNAGAAFPGGTGWLIFWAVFFAALSIAAVKLAVKQ